jgi:hypothetical protein
MSPRSVALLCRCIRIRCAHQQRAGYCTGGIAAESPSLRRRHCAEGPQVMAASWPHCRCCRVLRASVSMFMQLNVRRCSTTGTASSSCRLRRHRRSHPDRLAASPTSVLKHLVDPTDRFFHPQQLFLGRLRLGVGNPPPATFEGTRTCGDASPFFLGFLPPKWAPLWPPGRPRQKKSLYREFKARQVH